MSALMSSVEVQQPGQHEMFGTRPVLKSPVISRRVTIGQKAKAPPVLEAAVVPADIAGSMPGAQALFISEAQRANMERIASTPIVPLGWVRGPTQVQVTPEEAGERKSGRPKLNQRRTLSVNDLDNSITYIQRRTRELQKLIRGTHPDSDHTTRIVTAAIKDAVRKLCANLPEEKKVAIDEVVAGL